jgi:hypothetical protein
MIDPKEIRLGNYTTTTFNPDGGRVPIKMDENYFRKLLDYGGNEFYPIEINQGLFSGLLVHSHSNEHFEVVAHTRTFVFKYYNGTCWSVYLKNNSTYLEELTTTVCSIHEFQNLVYIITKKDLILPKFENASS